MTRIEFIELDVELIANDTRIIEIAGDEFNCRGHVVYFHGLTVFKSTQQIEHVAAINERLDGGINLRRVFGIVSRSHYSCSSHR